MLIKAPLPATAPIVILAVVRFLQVAKNTTWQFDSCIGKWLERARVMDGDGVDKGGDDAPSTTRVLGSVSLKGRW